jgi:adenosine deaminase
MPIKPFDFSTLPKVELHRHLEGSLRVKSLADVSRHYELGMNQTAELRSLVQILDGEPATVDNFLSKFSTLRQFYKSPEIIRRVTREAIEDAARDQIRYMELRFTPLALSKREGFQLGEVMDWVIEATEEAQRDFGIRTNLIASVNRHESVEIAETVVQLAIDRRERGIVGLDLAGNEAEFPAQPFIEVFREAQKAGMRLTVHAGEWGGAENVAHAIQELGAERIGHGVRVLEDMQIVHLARERKIAFEVCITSNYQSGVVAADAIHPVREMLRWGLVTTINTDDPEICQVDLSHEYNRAKKLGLTLDQLKLCTLAAVQAAFLGEDEKTTLINELQAAFQTFQG